MAAAKTPRKNELEVYPDLKIPYPQNPNRMWAFPIFGGLTKALILLPVFIWIMVLAMYDFFIILINALMVLFSGKYWGYCYNLNLGIMRLITKTILFFAGLTDRYPNFDFQTPDFTLNIPMPQASNRLFAIPVLGLMARIILLIPFGIFTAVIGNASRIGIVISSIPVFFSGKYPKTTYELTVDATRLSLAQASYFLGIKDNYPSFKVNFDKNNKFKIALIIIGVILTLIQYSGNRWHGSKNNWQNYQNTPSLYNQNFYR